MKKLYNYLLYSLMIYVDLPSRWKQKLKEYLLAHGEKDRSELGATDFFNEQTVILKFEDESEAKFNYPLVLEAPELNEVGVFTEHCGYHIFPMGVPIYVWSQKFNKMEQSTDVYPIIL